jgi:hypothetical protein
MTSFFMKKGLVDWRVIVLAVENPRDKSLLQEHIVRS